MGSCRNLSYADSRPTQEIEVSELKESVYGESHLDCLGSFDRADHLG
jgi:hypothetical protein